jgi:hypothetical protein
VLKIAVCLGLLTALAYYFSAKATQKILEYQLKSFGYTDIRILSTRPGITSLTIPHLEFYKEIAGVKYVLKIKDLTVNYSLTSIVNKELSSVELESGELIIKIPKTFQKVSETSLQSAQNIPSIASLPFKTLSAQKFNIKLEIDSGDLLNLTTDFIFKKADRFLNAQINLTTRTSERILFLPATQWVLSAVFKENQLTASGIGRSLSAHPITLDVSADYNFAKESGQLSLTSKPDASVGLIEITNQILKHFELPLQVSDGSLSAKLLMPLKYFKPEPFELNIATHNLGGIVKNGIFTGLSGSHSIAFSSNSTFEFASKAPSQIDINQILFGAEVQNISGLLNFAYDPIKKLDLDLSNIRANIFEGTVSSNALHFKSEKKQTSSKIKIDGISLASILEMYPQNKITATGILDGNIPLLIDSGGISVQAGKLQARSPGGVIRYVDLEGLSASKNEQIKLVAQVLQNFHYQKLSSGLELKKNGDLLLALKLSGKNPDLNFNQTTNVNLNIQENIYSLFDSLKIISGLDSKIEKTLGQ